MKATIEDNNGNTNVIEADSIIVIAGTRNGDKAKMNEIIEEAEPAEALAILATMALAFESGKSKDNGEGKSESLASILSGISDITS